MADIFQISNLRFVTVRKIPGSPCYLVRECWQDSDSPTGWWDAYENHYIRAKDQIQAATLYAHGLSTSSDVLAEVK